MPTNKFGIHKEIKNELDSVNACYDSIQNLLSSSMLSKNMKTKIYKTRCKTVLLRGCKTWNVTLKEKHGFRVSKNGALRKIFGFRSKVIIWDWRRLHVWEDYYLSCERNINLVIKSRRMLWAGHLTHR
jgi:hypothetical protein